MLVQGRVAVGCASLYNCPEFAKFDDALTGLIAAETRALGPRQSNLVLRLTVAARCREQNLMRVTDEEQFFATGVEKGSHRFTCRVSRV